MRDDASPKPPLLMPSRPSPKQGTKPSRTSPFHHKLRYCPFSSKNLSPSRGVLQVSPATSAADAARTRGRRPLRLFNMLC